MKGLKEELNVVFCFGLEDETCRRVLNTLKFVNEVFGACSQETGYINQTLIIRAFILRRSCKKSIALIIYIQHNIHNNAYIIHAYNINK